MPSTVNREDRLSGMGVIHFILVFASLLVAFMVLGIRTSERLSCTRTDDPSTIKCEHVEGRLFTTTKQHFEISDLSSIQITSSLVGSPSRSIRTLQARSTDGQSVVLLSISESDLSGILDLERRLKLLSTSKEKTVSFSRDEASTAKLLFVALVAWVAGVGYFVFRSIKKRPAH